MSGKVRFFTTFRARLMLLLTSFLVLTIMLVVVLDNWSRERTAEAVDAQNKQVAEALNTGYDDLAKAISTAMQSLDSDEYLYDTIGPRDMPRTVEHIIITEADGRIRDSTARHLVNGYLAVPTEPTAQVWAQDPVEGEGPTHEHLPKTYYHPLKTQKGLFWIVIVTTQQAIINKIEDASRGLASRNRELSNYRLAATTGLLLLALAIAVVIGWRFTRPVGELAGAARRVTAGELDFKVIVNRPDEIGQLAGTFNEMIAGLKSKRELEERLNSAERAAVIGRLTQGIAHEIRNPLNFINLSIDHVSTKFAPEDPARRSQFSRLLSSIRDEIGRLNRMVSDVLNFGRPARISPSPIDLRELVEETMALVRPQAEEQGITVAIESDGGPASVRGDRERLKSCLSNITINALQAMPAGGRLTARVGHANGAVEVSISDTGSGIAAEAVAKIFEPYFSTKDTGFGLGLAVTKKIVEEHMGTIEVRSQSEVGTTFTVRLPSGDAPASRYEGSEPEKKI